jgi:predicted nucleic acid-binding protein
MIVLDANILIRGVLGRRVRELIESYAPQGVRFLTPEVAFADAEKYLPPLLKKRGKPYDISETVGCVKSSNQSVLKSMPRLKAMPGSACAVAMRTTGLS